MTTALALLSCRPLAPHPISELLPPTTSTPVGPTAPPATPITDEARRAIEEAVAADLAASDASGASIAIWRDGAVVLAEGFGTRHPESDEPVTADTLFQIGSDTKKLTAIAVLSAVERGELALDDTVADVLGDLEVASSPDWDDLATVHHLLTHQGALYDYTPWDDDPDDAVLAGRAYGVLADTGYAMAPPGAFHNYANPNYSLAGLLLERATGRAWADAVREDVFAPLGLDSTFARLAEVPLERAAAATGLVRFEDPTPMDPWDASTYEWGVIEPEDQADNAFTRPAGLVWSTASDVVAVAAFLLDGDPDVLSDALRAELTAPHVEALPGVPELGAYGYGVYTWPTLVVGDLEYDVPLWTHGGVTVSMTSGFYVLPEQRLAVAILSNGSGDDFTATAAAALTTVATLPPPHPLTPLPEAVAADFEGAWTDPFGVGTLSVTRDPFSGALRVDAPGFDDVGVGHASVLTPYCVDVARLGVSGRDYDLTWIDGGAWVRNRLFVGTRSAGTAAAARAPGVPDAAPRLLGPSPFANRLRAPGG